MTPDERLLPAALQGIDVRGLLRGADEMDTATRAADLLGWRPVVTLGDGMAECERWLADQELLS